MVIVRGQGAQSSVATASTGFEVEQKQNLHGSDASSRTYIGLDAFKTRTASNTYTPEVADSPQRQLDMRVGHSRAQIQALLHKNVSWQKRQKCTNCCQICIPAVLLFIVVLIQAIVDSTFAAKSSWQVKRNQPKEVDVENLLPAMVRELGLDGREDYFNSVGQYCFGGREDDDVELKPKPSERSNCLYFS